MSPRKLAKQRFVPEKMWKMGRNAKWPMIDPIRATSFGGEAALQAQTQWCIHISWTIGIQSLHAIAIEHSCEYDNICTRTHQGNLIFAWKTENLRLDWHMSQTQIGYDKLSDACPTVTCNNVGVRG